jgi:flagellar motor protein MotB
MAELPAEEEIQTFVPTWMVTYSDTITLMLCFFVMMLTFSGASEDAHRPAQVSPLKGSKIPPVVPGPPGEENLATEAPRLSAARLGTGGAEKPPLQSESPLDELTRYYPDVDISHLEQLKGALVIRMPLVEVFGTGLEIGPQGQKVLDPIVKMVRGQAYSVIVRTKVGPGVPETQREARSVMLSGRMVQYLRQGAGKACEDIGLSHDVELGPSPLGDDQCEIAMLEV